MAITTIILLNLVIKIIFRLVVFILLHRFVLIKPQLIFKLVNLFDFMPSFKVLQVYEVSVVDITFWHYAKQVLQFLMIDLVKGVLCQMSKINLFKKFPYLFHFVKEDGMICLSP